MSSPGRGSPVSLPSPHCRTWAAFPQVIQKHCLQRGTKNLWKTQTCLFPYNSAEKQANRVLKLTGSALFFLKKKEENPLVSATSQVRAPLYPDTKTTRSGKGQRSGEGAAVADFPGQEEQR